MGETSSHSSRPGHKAGSSGWDESVSRVGLVKVTRSVLVIIGFAVPVSRHISFATPLPPIYLVFPFVCNTSVHSESRSVPHGLILIH
jgi:hypothetical protein